MAGKWDSALKQLVKVNPQHFVDWLLEGGQFLRELSPHLNRSLDVDTLYEVMLNGQRIIFHIEFQRRTEADVARRVWEYNVLATCLLNAIVLSFVIYLKKDGTVVESPFILKHPNGSEIHRFYFTNIKLWEVPTDVFRKTGLVALLPLLPLTQEGASHEVVEETVTDIERLVEDEAIRKELVSLTLTLASLAFLGKQEDQDWLTRRFRMQHDILRDTPIYQMIMQEGREEERIRQQKQERLTIQRIVQAKFPRLARLAIERTEAITDTEKLQDLIVFMSIAHTEDEARQYLTETDINGAG